MSRFNPKPHYLYRCYDADGLLLYIGCTVDPKKRLRGHTKHPRSIASHVLRTALADMQVDAEVYPSSVEGLAAEAEAIRAEKPLLNLQESGETHLMQWIRVARYLEANGVPLEAGSLARCTDCRLPNPLRYIRPETGMCGSCSDIAQDEAGAA